MRNYYFHAVPKTTELQVQDKEEKTILTICCREDSVIYLDVVSVDGSRKERQSVEEILDLLSDATTDDLKSFASMIYLFGRRM